MRSAILAHSLAALCLVGASEDHARLTGFDAAYNCGLGFFADELGPTKIPIPAAPMYANGSVLVDIQDHSQVDPDGNEPSGGLSFGSTFPIYNSEVPAFSKHEITIYRPIVMSEGVQANGEGATLPLIAFGRQNGMIAGIVLTVKPSELVAAYQGSHTICAVLGHTLFHESLHAKLNAQNVTQGAVSCAHLAIANTAAKRSCEKAAALEACLEALADRHAPLPEHCPERQETDDGDLETDAEYGARLRELKAGLCGMVETERANWQDREELARCCFCQRAAGCAPGQYWQNPCGSVDLETGEEQEQVIFPPSYAEGECSGDVPIDEVIEECPAC